MPHFTESRLKINAVMLRPDVYKTYGMPTCKTSGSAGVDLRACVDAPVTIAPNQVVMVPSGLKIHVADPQYAAVLLPRSGLGHKNGIVLGNLVGLIDSDYIGEMGISVWNRSEIPFSIMKGDRIAQCVIIRVEHPEFVWVDSLEDSERGEGGFGSTGVSE